MIPRGFALVDVGASVTALAITPFLQKMRTLALLGVLAIFVTNAFVWSLAIPYNRAPDEYMHMAMVDFIAREHRLPVFGKDKDMYLFVTPAGQPVEYYALYPSLSYLAGAAATALPIEPFRAARLISLLAAAGVVCIAFALGRELFPHDSTFAFGIGSIVAFLPQFTFLAAYANSDALAALASAATLLLCVRGMNRGWTGKRAALLGLALGVVLLSKYNAYIMLPFSAVVLALSLRGSVVRVAARLVTIAALALAVSGWWFARNLGLYGELMPNEVLFAAVRQEAPNWIMRYADRGYNVVTLSTETRWWQWTFESFWGKFDYMKLDLDQHYYTALLVFTLTCSLGLVVGLLRRFSARQIDLRDRRIQLQAVFGALIIGTIAFSLYASLYRDFQAQGRYLFAALIPITVYLLLGIRELAPGRLWRGAAVVATSAGLLVLNLISLLHYIIPAYIPSFWQILGDL